jgi:hypothetical protein
VVDVFLRLNTEEQAYKRVRRRGQYSHWQIHIQGEGVACTGFENKAKSRDPESTFERVSFLWLV